MDKELTPAWVPRWSEGVRIKVKTFIGQTIVLDAIHSPIFDDITANIQDQEGINLQCLFSVGQHLKTDHTLSDHKSPKVLMLSWVLHLRGGVQIVVQTLTRMILLPWLWAPQKPSMMSWRLPRTSVLSAAAFSGRSSRQMLVYAMGIAIASTTGRCFVCCCTNIRPLPSFQTDKVQPNVTIHASRQWQAVLTLSHGY